VCKKFKVFVQRYWIGVCKDIGSVCAKTLDRCVQRVCSDCAKTLDRCVQRVWSDCAKTSVCKSLGMVYVNGEPL